jgi:hypothetical protein
LEKEDNMTNVTTMPGLQRAREFIEFDDGRWGLANDENLSDNAELGASAQRVVARRLKDALWGLAPLFGREWLLDLCARIIDEDFDPHGPQTEHYDLETYGDDDDDD